MNYPHKYQANRMQSKNAKLINIFFLFQAYLSYGQKKIETNFIFAFEIQWIHYYTL
jgi:hypothetical protein